MVIEIADWESPIFEEIMSVLKNHSDIYHIRPDEEVVMSLPGIELNLNRRKVFCGQREISLTVKPKMFIIWIKITAMPLHCRNRTYSAFFSVTIGKLSRRTPAKEQLNFLFIRITSRSRFFR